MILKTMIPALFVFGLIVSSGAAAQSSSGTDVHLFVENVIGQSIPDAPVQYVDANGVTHKAQLMSDGSCMIIDAPSKLELEVTDPATGSARFEFMLTSAPYQEYLIRISGDEGAAKVDPMLRPRHRKPLSTVVFLPTFGVLSPAIGGMASSSSGPSNDDCANAATISGEGIFLYDTLHATTDGPEHDACDESGSAAIINDIWYCWTAPCTGEATVDNCFAVGDSRIAVYDGCGCPATDGDLLGCNDDACGLLGRQSRVTFPVIQGQEYKIRIGSYPFVFFPVTAGALAIKCTGAPPNDDCHNAQYVGLPSSTMGFTEGADVDDVDFCGTSSTSPGVWYTVTGNGKELTAETCGWADYDTKISVFCRGCGPDMLCIDGNDDDCTDFRSRVSWCSQEGAEYAILVHGFGGQSGNFLLDVYESGDGYCEPDIRCIFEGACCEGGECQVLTEDECASDGGVFFGDLTGCCGAGIYELEDCYDSFEDISYSGYEISLGDDDGQEIPVGFGFDFFGKTYFYVSVSSNGYLTFGSDDSSNSPEEIPHQNDPDALIAPYWTDWNPNENGRIHYEVLGTAGNRRLIVQWTEIAHFDVGGGESTFQAVLYEADGSMTFRYGQLDSSALGFSYAVGIENEYGSHGYGMFSGGIYSGDCIRYVPVMAPFCDYAPDVVIDYEVDFSYLDGSSLDTDGQSDGVFKTNNLTLECGGVILIDVEHASFLVHGEMVIRDCAAIRNPSFGLYHTGPSIYIEACGDVKLLGDARIRAEGKWCGGSVTICTGKSFIMDGVVANIEATATETYGSKGGWVDIEARRRIDIGPFHPYITVKGEEAGHIHLLSCDGGNRAIEVEGHHLDARGWGPYGVGGEVVVRARQGGIWVPSLDKIVAYGAASDGTIDLIAGTVYGPPGGPNTTPVASVYTWSPDSTPCDCDEEDD